MLALHNDYPPPGLQVVEACGHCLLPPRYRLRPYYFTLGFGRIVRVICYYKIAPIPGALPTDGGTYPEPPFVSVIPVLCILSV